MLFCRIDRILSLDVEGMCEVKYAFTMDNNVVRTILRQMFNKIVNLAQFGWKLLDAKYIKWKLKHCCNFWQIPGVSK